MELQALWDVTNQFNNKNGTILTSGKVYIYFQNRTALATTYHDEAGTVVNSNPILLDNNGRATVFADPVYSYTIVVCDYYGKELFSQDIILHNAIATVENVLITGSDGSVTIDTTELSNGVKYDLSVNTDIIATKQSVDDVKSDLDDLTLVVNNNTIDIDNIQDELTAKKDKQTTLTFNGSTTKTIKNITQNANGEMTVEFQDIDLPLEVPNVEITSPNGTIDVQTSIDTSTNTKTFEIDVNNTNMQYFDGYAGASHYEDREPGTLFAFGCPMDRWNEYKYEGDFITNNWQASGNMQFKLKPGIYLVTATIRYAMTSASAANTDGYIRIATGSYNGLENGTRYKDWSREYQMDENTIQMSFVRTVLDDKSVNSYIGESTLYFYPYLPYGVHYAQIDHLQIVKLDSVVGQGSNTADASFWRGSGSHVTVGNRTGAYGTLLPINTTSLSNKGSDITVNNDGEFVLQKGVYFYHGTVELNSGSEVYDFLQEIEFTTGMNATYVVWDRSIAYQRITLNLCGIAHAKVDGDYSLEFDIKAVTHGDATFFAHLLEVDVFRINGVGNGSGSGGSSYTDGDGIDITSDTISVKAGKGLGFDVDKKLEVKVGDGLAYDSENKVITIDSDVSDVVATVNKLESDLDTKLTVNFDMAGITHTYDFADPSVTTLSDGATMLCQAFTVPINCNIRLATENEDPTLIGIYSKQSYSNKIMLGLYVYDFDTGFTDYVADTGPVTVATGRNEFPIKHINPDITELKSNCVYYAALYLPSSHGNGLYLASCQSYSNASYINATPRFTVGVQNITYNGSEISLASDTTGRLDYNDGNGNYYIGPWSNGYNEIPNAPRFFMQLRNGAAEEPVAVEPFVNIPTYTVSTKAINSLFTDADQLGTPTYPVVYREVTPQRNVTIDWWQSWSPESTDANKFGGIIYSSAFDSVLYDISNITVTDLGQTDGLYTRKYTPNSALTLTAGVTYRFPVWLGNLNYTDNCVTYDTPATSSVLQLFQSAWSINQWSSYKRLNDVAAMPLILHDTDGNTYRI